MRPQRISPIPHPLPTVKKIGSVITSGIDSARRELTTHTHSLDERAHTRLVASNVVFQVVARLDPNPHTLSPSLKA